jgi:hypothetical protein
LARVDTCRVIVLSGLVPGLVVCSCGCGADSSDPVDVRSSSAVASPSQPASSDRLASPVAVGELLPSPKAREQARAIQSLRAAGIVVETNGVEEAVLASFEDGAIGVSNGRKLAGLETLETIQLWNCPDADDGLVELLSGLASLRVLAIRGGRLTDACFDSLSLSPALESLNLGNSAGLTGDGVAGLLGRGRIKRLYLDRTALSDSVVEGWPVTNSLEMLNVNHTRLGTKSALRLREFAGLKSVFAVEAGIAAGEVATWRVARPECLIYDGRERP